MPEDLQKQYLTYLIETYKATLPMLGDLFHVHYTTVLEIRNRLGVTAKAKRVSDAERPTRDAMWAAFRNGVVGGGDAVKETPREPEKVETLPVRCPDEPEEAAMAPADTESATEAEPVVVKTPMLDMTELSATFNGWFTPEAFLGWITKLPIPEAEVRIQVEIEKV